MIARLRESIAFASTALVYFTALGVLLLVVKVGSLDLWAGLAWLTSITALVLLFSIRAETRQTHQLVNSQHDDLVARIKQLTDALVAAGIEVPRDPTGESPGEGRTS